MMTFSFKTLRHYSESLAARGIFSFLRCLPAAWASTIMGRIMRYIGLCLPSSRYALINLHIAFPHKNKAQYRRIIRDCWENLGRTLAETVHIPNLPENSPSGPGWRVEGADYIRNAQKSGKPIIFFSGHLGNWELMPAAAARYGIPLAPFYRAPNNPFIHDLLCSVRRQAIGQDIPMFPKGAKGAKEAIRYLSKGGNLGILGDQKMNDGIEVLFFNRPTMTATAAAALALRFKALILPAYTWREGPARLVITVNPPIDPTEYLPPAFSRQEALHSLTQTLNDQLQSWIEEKPHLWLWPHRRWEKSLYRRNS